jgi:hypothetical protein
MLPLQTCAVSQLVRTAVYTAEARRSSQLNRLLAWLRIHAYYHSSSALATARTVHANTETALQARLVEN